MKIIMADDFTGANDCGVKLATKGYHVEVQLVNHYVSTADVLVIDTDSRALQPDAAYEVIAKQLTGLNKTVYFKKIDSTIRGNIVSELRPFCESGRYDTIVFCPAYIELGRTVQDGILYVDGRPITKTEFSRDKKTPVTESSLIQLLQPLGYEIELIQSPLTQQPKKETIYIIDAVQQASFLNIIQSFQQYERLLFVGAAGLLEALYAQHASQPKVMPPIQRMLFISASRSYNTAQQLEQLSQQVDVHVMPFDLPQLFSHPVTYANQATNSLAQKHVAFYVPTTKEATDWLEQYRLEQQWSMIQLSTYIVQVIGQFMKGFMAKQSFDAVTLTGGDTAKAVCQALQIAAITLVDEPVVGIARGYATYSGHSLHIFTKAGGFGDAQALVTLLRSVEKEG